MTTILGAKIGPIGYGVMGLMMPHKKIEREQAFSVMKQALNNGANFWNGAEYYGTPENNSLHLLRDYFERYPEDADKVVLSIKGCMGADRVADGSPDAVRRSVGNCLKILNGKKSIDLFQCGRVDPRVPIETTIGTLAELVHDRSIGGIGLSEASAESLQRAARVHKITALEIEVSLWQDHVLHNGVADICGEHGIAIVAYSPIGRGFLTGQISSPDDIPDGDARRNFPRFKPENFHKNIELVRGIQKIAEKKGVTAAQLSIAWVRQLSDGKGRPLFIPIPGASSESRVEENCQVIELSEDELAQISRVQESCEISGDRYPEQFMVAVDR